MGTMLAATNPLCIGNVFATYPMLANAGQPLSDAGPMPGIDAGSAGIVAAHGGIVCWGS